MGQLRYNIEEGAERLIQNSWVIAAVCSLLIHLIGLGAYQTSKHIHWRGQQKFLDAIMPRNATKLPAIMNWFKPPINKPALQQLLSAKPPQKQPPPPMETELPLTLTLVDPVQATVEEPERPKYYAALNSLAANPNIRKPSEEPDVKGTQNKVPDTLDKKFTGPPPAPKPAPQPPEPPAPEPPKTAQANSTPQAGNDRETLAPKPKPKGGDTPGDLAMARPSDVKRDSDGVADSDREQLEKRLMSPDNQPKQATTSTANTSRPRTLIEARMRSQSSSPPSRAMEKEGGVRRLLAVSSLDAKGTPLGAYDEAMVAVIRQRWYDLLDKYRYAGERKGKVVLDFRLHSNGRITDMKVSECTVGDLLASVCQLAITDPAPYPKWPDLMVRLVGREYRDVRFTFFYE